MTKDKINPIPIICIIIVCILIFRFGQFFNSRYQQNQNQTISSNVKYQIFDQIKSNIIDTKDKIGDTRFGLVLKNGYPIIRLISNAFGNNAISDLASYVEKYVDIFYVSNIYDGIRLRKNRIKKPICILYLIDPIYINLAVKYDLEIIIPSIKWYYLAIEYLRSNKKIKAHIWFDSGLGKEGAKTHKEIIQLYQFLIFRPDIKLIGLGTKYNTANKLTNQLTNQSIPSDIINQHNDFVKLVDKIADPELIIHTACTFEVSRNFIASYFGSKGSVRVGTLIYRNIEWTQPLLDIKEMSHSDCYGYYCTHTDRKSKGNFKMGLIKNYLSLQINNLNELHIYDNKGIKQNMKMGDYDPMTFIINPKSKLKIGSDIILKYNDLFG